MTTIYDCTFKGSEPICPKCGRMVPDTCGAEDPRKEVKATAPVEEDTSSLAGTVKALKASGSSQEPAGESEAPQATQVAEAPSEATSEAPKESETLSPAKSRTRKAAS